MAVQGRNARVCFAASRLLGCRLRCLQHELTLEGYGQSSNWNFRGNSVASPSFCFLFLVAGECSSRRKVELSMSRCFLCSLLIT